MIPAALALLAVSSSTPPASGASDAPDFYTETEAGGTHIRLETAQGPIHIFAPAGYDRRSAGIVVYVHGIHIDVDEAWREHRLAAQFAASGRNALFIAPEAPTTPEEEPAWGDLRALVTTALRRAHLRRPPGPLIAAGHSGAYRTLVRWLGVTSLQHLILLDALYGNEEQFRDWLDRDPDHKMTLVVKGTARWAYPFVRATPYAITVDRIPRQIEALSRAERIARLLCLQSQYGHMELISEGQVLPVLLQRTALHRLRPVRVRALSRPSKGRSRGPIPAR